jgi:hypothetical protein
MGKHAQYRKRGSAPSPVPSLPAPNGVLLTAEDGILLSTTLSGANPGGSVVMCMGPSAIGPWSPVETQVWHTDINWGYLGDYGGPFLSAYEIGNGTDYAGNSPMSASIQVI